MRSSPLLRELGVTRLSLGVENFDDRILELNGRAHRSPEIYRVYEQARRLDFPQINIDLIAGMIGESDANWRAAIDRTIELSPDSVTIYQMELPLQHDDQRQPPEGRPATSAARSPAGRRNGAG